MFINVCSRVPTICISFSEIAKDYLHRIGNYVVIGGLISPVHDAYGKKELEPASHRINMLKLALLNSDWIKLSDWETNQESWSRTRTTIQHHQVLLRLSHLITFVLSTFFFVSQNLLNAALNNSNLNEFDNDMLTWIPNNIKNGTVGPVQVKLLCGADLLESFGTPGLWADEDVI